jgi:hypothetical protein
MSSGTVYYACTALDELERAQAELDAHIGSDAGGRCPTCHEEVPCAAREAATRLFAQYGWLPRRRPGAARVRPAGISHNAGGTSHQ